MKSLTLKQLFLFLALIVVGFALRFYNYDQRLTFGPEQALSLSDSAQKLPHFTLLGMPYLQRQNSLSFNLFHSPIFSYSLIPLQLLFNFDPFPITIYFTLLNLLTGIVLFIVTLKVFRNFYLSFLASLFHFLSPVMIHHSLFLWIINYFPLLGILTFYFARQYLITGRSKYVFILGLLSGLGIGLDIAYASLVLLLLVLLLTRSHRLRNFLLFLSGLLLANFPTVIFDLRHNFFHLHVYYQFFQDYLSHKVSVGAVYYHFLNFYPLFYILLAAICTLLAKISRQYFLIAVLSFLFSLTFLTHSTFWNPNRSLGMPPGITLSTYKQVSALIAADLPGNNFNVAALQDFDTRANPIRYLLTYVYHTPPRSVIDYPHSSPLYVLHLSSYDLTHPEVWELQSNLPYNATLMRTFGSYQLSKLTSIPSP